MQKENNETIETKQKIILPPIGDNKTDQELIDNFLSHSDEEYRQMGKEIEEAEKKEKERKNQENLQELKIFRKKWEKEIDLDDDKKKVIIEAVDKISPRVTIEPDGSKLVEFELGGKIYKCLDVNLKEHSDIDYFKLYKQNWQTNNEVNGLGMNGDDTSKRNNRKLAEYVENEKANRNMKIPTIEFQRKLINKLGDDAGLTKMSDKIAMWMYLTGNYGFYRLTMGDDNSSNSQVSSRSLLYCNDCNHSFSCKDIDMYGDIYSANLCLIACS